eukprot:CAMPEP_0182481328 /NCGR_PEP_ID=MMETSP1319-20130603/37178_1 /TAXON_ID=172717 /ORGANISM="Bolidomonas pacifica, Strain RCC208" /LENGTH=52 /DNA_ID=CAMNT_0024682935 /DNA_START=227 /DNA_END=385 /DNA_ORIENTATION=-
MSKDDDATSVVGGGGRVAAPVAVIGGSGPSGISASVDVRGLVRQFCGGWREG